MYFDSAVVIKKKIKKIENNFTKFSFQADCFNWWSLDKEKEEELATVNASKPCLRKFAVQL